MPVPVPWDSVGRPFAGPKVDLCEIPRHYSGHIIVVNPSSGLMVLIVDCVGACAEVSLLGGEC